MCKTVLSIMALTLTSFAFGWGHLDFVGGDWGQSTLTYALVQKKEITFCVNSEVPDKFPPKNIAQQVNHALHLWIGAAPKYQNAAIKEIPCQGNHPDLVVQIGPETDFTEMSGYHVPQISGDKFYSLVKLNSNYTYTEEKIRYQVVDFAQMIPVSLSPKNVMKDISEDKPLSVSDFSGKYHVHYQRAYLSSYKMLLHELGHAFGLCDTEASLFKYCDLKFRTQRPPAVMNHADFFYLTDDDKEGLRALIQRFELNRTY